MYPAIKPARVAQQILAEFLSHVLQVSMNDGVRI